MNRARFVVPGLLFGALIGVLVLWRTLETSRREPVRVLDTVSPPTEPEAPVEALRNAVVEDPAPRRSAGRESTAPRSAARLVGKVALPAGAPRDESLRVVARELPRGGMPGGEPAPLPGRRSRYTELDVVATATLRPDGAFELVLPPGAGAVSVDLDGRFLFLEDLVGVPASFGGPLRLDARLGGGIAGRLVPPVGCMVDLAGLEVELIGRGPEGVGVLREVHAGDDLSFAFGGLAEEATYSLRADPLVLAPASIATVRVAAGEEMPVELALERGVQLTGRVVDEAGMPVADAVVKTHTKWRTFAGSARATATDAAGHFELVGVPAGEIALEAEHEGYAKSETEAVEYADGAVVTDLELALARGNRIGGTIAWPDGRKAGRALVRVSWSQPEDGEARGDADDDGAFTVTGLGDPPFRVLAEAVPTPEGESLRRRGATPWRASEEDVAADAHVALVLERPAVVRGRVVDDRGEPVPVFWVFAAPADRSEGLARVQRRIREESGRFELELFATGWKVGARAEGYLLRGEPAPLEPPFADELLLTLDRTGSVSGIVRDPAGTPVPEATVVCVEGARTEIPGIGRGGKRVESDGEGRFELRDLGPGTYTLGASSSDWAMSEPRTIDLAPGQRLGGTDLVVRQGGSVVGELYDEAGEPQRGRTVQLTGGGVRPEATDVTDARGHFEIRSVTPGTYQVMAQPDSQRMRAETEGLSQAERTTAWLRELHAATVEIREGETTHVVLGQDESTSIHVHGRVTSAGEPVPNAVVLAIQEGKALLTTLRPAATDAAGAYELDVPGPGEYGFVVRLPGASDGIDFLVTVPDQPEHRQDLELPGGGITGTVLGRDGAPLAGMRVFVAAESGLVNVGSIGGPPSTTTDADGRYALAHLRPGPYSVRTGGGAHGWQVRDGVQVEDGRMRDGVDFQLRESGSLTGTVRGLDGRGVGSASIFVRDERGTLVHDFSRVQTDATGAFAYPGLAAGTYTVSARTATQATTEEVSVHVYENRTTEVTLTVDEAVTLVVEVTDADGRPLRADVRVLDSRGHAVHGMLGRSSLENALERGFSTKEHRIGPLPRGRYRVLAAKDGKSVERMVDVAGGGERRVQLRLE